MHNTERCGGGIRHKVNSEGRRGIRIVQHLFEVPVRPPKAPGREAASKHIPGPRAVDAFDCERSATNFTASASRKASIRSERHAHERSAVFTLDGFEGPSEIRKPGQGGWKFLRGDDRVDLTKQRICFRLDIFDVDDRGNARLTSRCCGRRGRSNVLAIDQEQAARRGRFPRNSIETQRRIAMPEHCALTCARVDENHRDAIGRAGDCLRGADVHATGLEGFA